MDERVSADGSVSVGVILFGIFPFEVISLGFILFGTVPLVAYRLGPFCLGSSHWGHPGWQSLS